MTNAIYLTLELKSSIMRVQLTGITHLSHVVSRRDPLYAKQEASEETLYILFIGIN